MLNILEETKEQYRADSVHKELVIRIPGANIILRNEDLVSQSVSLKESIESSDNLSFTGCIASVFKFSCANLIANIKNEYIEADITADNTAETIPLFRGYVDEVTNPSHEEITTTVTCYDIFYKANNIDVKAWYDSLTFPITIMNFRNALCDRLGIEQEPDYLPNDVIPIQKSIEDTSISGTQLLKYICQINGRFGQIGRNGKLIYRHLVEGTEALYPREDLFPADDIYPSDENALESINKAHYKTVQFESYRVNPITKVQLVNKEGAITATAGSGTNAFTMQNNPLIYEMSTANLQSVAINLYNTTQGLWYVPAKVTSIGLPYVECGDFVLVAAKHSIVRHYVLTRTLTGIQSLTDVYEAEGDLDQPIYKPTIEQKISANTQAIHTETSNRISAINSEASARANADANEANIRANQISAVNVRCDNLVAKDAQIESLVATKASITDLNATNANVSNLSANVANIGNLVATKASIAELNAVRAKVNTIEANYVSTSRLNSWGSTYTGYLSCGSLRVNGTSAPWCQVNVWTGSAWRTYNLLGYRVN